MLEWQDDFEDGQIDPEKWLVSEEGQEYIYERDGALNFDVPKPHTGTVGASITPLPQTNSIQEVSFAATIVSEGFDESGGAGLEVELSDGQTISAYVGPGIDGPGFDISICSRDVDGGGACRDLEAPGYPEIKSKIRIPVQFLRDGSLTRVIIDNKFYYEAETAQISTAKLGIYADGDSTPHVAIDDFLIKYGP